MESILLKLSGEIFKKAPSVDGAFSLQNLITDIKSLCKKRKVGIVIGGGNIFRGNREGKEFGLNKSTSDYIGMLATVMNGLTLQDLLEQQSVKTSLFSAIEIPQIANHLNQKNITRDLEEKDCIIFAGGTGNPFFTTDTNAIIRALQINATTVLKGTKVDGVFTSDPRKDSSATIIKNATYKEILDKNLKVMDLSAITLAKENNITIKVFNIFNPNALDKVIQDKSYGSTIFNQKV